MLELPAAAVSVVRACLSFWTGTSGTVQLGHLIDQAFQALADGFPEDSVLREITALPGKRALAIREA